MRCSDEPTEHRIADCQSIGDQTNEKLKMKNEKFWKRYKYMESCSIFHFTFLIPFPKTACYFLYECTYYSVQEQQRCLQTLRFLPSYYGNR